MNFLPTDPNTWVDPQFHPDFGVDSAKSVEMLQRCSLALLAAIPDITSRLHINADDGVLFCELFTADAKLGDLYCVESTTDRSLHYGLFVENADSTKEFEFYTNRVPEICRIVAAIINGEDLEPLHDSLGKNS